MVPVLPDPSLVPRPVPRGAWAPMPAVHGPLRVRALGLLVGVAVGAAAALAAGAYGADLGDTATASLAAPIVGAGGIGGWLLGPMAWTSTRRRDWVAAAVVLAIAAVGIGDAIVVAGVLLAGSATGQVAAGVSEAVALLPGIVGLFIVGLIVVGWFALPFTMGASLIWAAIMWRLRQWAPPAAGGGPRPGNRRAGTRR